MARFLALLLFAAPIRLWSGSWDYEYPPHTYPAIVADGQAITLKGSHRFSFKGVVQDYWDDIYNCPPLGDPVVATVCLPGKIALSWYSGTGNGMDHRGVGIVGPTGTVRIFTYGRMVMPPLVRDGAHRVKTAVLPLLGEFEHDGLDEPITGKVLVTVEFEQEDETWEIEAIDYDVIHP